MAGGLTAAVLGGADCVWRDFEAACRLVHIDLLIAVNGAFREYPGKVDHAVSFHSDLLPYWTERRRKSGYPDPDKYWTVVGQRPILGVAMGFVPAWGGSSGLIAAQVGMEVADRVILCGVPLDPAAEHFDKPGVWDEAIKHRHAWQAHAEELRAKVRSMSGWTAELLGTSTADWLAAE